MVLLRSFSFTLYASITFFPRSASPPFLKSFPKQKQNYNFFLICYFLNICNLMLWAFVISNYEFCHDQICLNLKYHIFTSSGCKDVGIKKIRICCNYLVSSLLCYLSISIFSVYLSVLSFSEF